MPLLSRQDFVKYLAEILVVVLGILIAFQVEGWRERRQLETDLELAIDRLADETQQNILFCDRFVRVANRTLSAVEKVVLSLSAGELSESDKEQFDVGLSVVSALPNRPLLTSVADEMISTGLLKQVQDAELRLLIATLQSLVQSEDNAYPMHRESVRDLSNELANHIDVIYSPDTPGSAIEEIGIISTETRIAVLYKFDELVAARRLRNLFYEAYDAHSDHLAGLQRKCAVVSAISDRLRNSREVSE